MTNFLYGMRQPIDQAATLLAKAFPSQAPSVAAANQAGADAEKESGLPGVAGKVAEFAGSMVPLAAATPGAIGTSMLARLGSGAATGAVSGALNPVDPNDPNFWSQTGHNALVGGLAGGATPIALGAAARVVNPNAVDRTALLREAGVSPTVGQTLGGTAGSIEQKLSSWPIVGDLIRSGQSRALDQFDRGALNQALQPIGEQLETNKMGRDALLEMSNKIDNAWTAAIPQTAGQFDPQLMSEIQNLRTMAQSTARGPQFDNVLKSQIFDNISPAGVMSGDAFKNADSAFGQIIRDNVYGHGVPWEDRQFGNGVRTLQASMRDWLGRVNPQASEDLGNARTAYLRMLPIERASTALGGEPGVFSAAQLQAGSKAVSPSLKQFMTGQAVMQPYAEAGKAVLGNTVPDSGTAGRSLLAMLGSGLAGGMAGHQLAPETMGYLAATGMGTGLAAGAYSPIGQRLATLLAASRPAGAQPVANAVRNFGPLASALVPRVGGGSNAPP
jgi:hypothetical protein